MLFRKKHRLCDMFYFRLLNVAYKKPKHSRRLDITFNTLNVHTTSMAIYGILMRTSIST